jgi:hypothetical protein
MRRSPRADRLDASREAARAVADAMPILAKADVVDVLVDERYHRAARRRRLAGTAAASVDQPMGKASADDRKTSPPARLAGFPAGAKRAGIPLPMTARGYETRMGQVAPGAHRGRAALPGLRARRCCRRFRGASENGPRLPTSSTGHRKAPSGNMCADDASIGDVAETAARRILS